MISVSNRSNFWTFRLIREFRKLIVCTDCNLLNFHRIGKNISTKSVGSNSREDITESYKQREKSNEERDVMEKVLKRSDSVFARYYLREKFADVKFKLLLLDDIIIGQPFTVKFRIQNTSSRSYTVNAAIFVRTTYYTGEIFELVKERRAEVVVGPESEHDLLTLVTYKEYEDKLVDQNTFEVAAAADIVETDYQFHTRDSFRVRMPDVKFELAGKAIAGQPVTVYAYLKNPLPRYLTSAYFIIDGPGLMDPMKKVVKGSVPPGEEARVVFSIVPKHPGEKTISAKFFSRELGDDVDGFRNIIVGTNNNSVIPATFEETDLNENVLR